MTAPPPLPHQQLESASDLRAFRSVVLHLPVEQPRDRSTCSVGLRSKMECQTSKSLESFDASIQHSSCNQNQLQKQKNWPIWRSSVKKIPWISHNFLKSTSFLDPLAPPLGQLHLSHAHLLSSSDPRLVNCKRETDQLTHLKTPCRGRSISKFVPQITIV